MKIDLNPHKLIDCKNVAKLVNKCINKKSKEIFAQVDSEIEGEGVNVNIVTKNNNMYTEVCQQQERLKLLTDGNTFKYKINYWVDCEIEYDAKNDKYYHRIKDDYIDIDENFSKAYFEEYREEKAVKSYKKVSNYYLGEFNGQYCDFIVKEINKDGKSNITNFVKIGEKEYAVDENCNPYQENKDVTTCIAKFKELLIKYIEEDGYKDGNDFDSKSSFAELINFLDKKFLSVDNIYEKIDTVLYINHASLNDYKEGKAEIKPYEYGNKDVSYYFYNDREEDYDYYDYDYDDEDDDEYFFYDEDEENE